MAAASGDTDSRAQFQILLNEIEQETPDLLVKNYCNLVRYIITNDFPHNQLNLNRRLSATKFNRKLNRIKNNLSDGSVDTSREIDLQSYFNLKISLDELIDVFIQLPFDNTIKRTVLRNGLETFADKTGSKEFSRRSELMINCLKATITAAELYISNDEMTRFLEYPGAFYYLFSPNKDTGQSPSNRKFFANNENLKAIGRIQPYILVLVRKYKKSFRHKENKTNEDLANIIKDIAIAKNTPLEILQEMFSKYLPLPRLNDVFTIAGAPSPNAEVVNNFMLLCPEREIEIRPCPPGSQKPFIRTCQVKPGNLPITPEDITELCQLSMAGGKGTRKRRHKKRKTRRHRRN